MEIAIKAFSTFNLSMSIAEIINILKELGIPDDIIESARKQAEADLAQ